jgi:DNA-binding transcriptional ArsR family regulator
MSLTALTRKKRLVTNEAQTWARAQTVGNSLQKCVLIELGNYADEEWSCFPGVKQLARTIEVTDRSVRAAISSLEEAEFISIKTRIRENRSHSSNRYYLNSPDAPHIREDLDLELETPEFVASRKTKKKRKETVDPESPSGGGTEPGSGGVLNLLQGGTESPSGLLNHQGNHQVEPPSTEEVQDLENSHRLNGSVGTHETPNETEADFEVQKPKSAPTDEEQWTPALESPPVGAGSGLENQDPSPYANSLPVVEKVVTQEMLDVAYESFRRQGMSEHEARKYARRSYLPKYKCDAESFLNTIPIKLTNREKSEFYEDVCTLFGKGWQGPELANTLCFGWETAYSQAGTFRKRLKTLITRNSDIGSVSYA